MATDAERLNTISQGIQTTWELLRRAAANIAGLLQMGKATCDEVRAYNLWAIAVYNTQRGILATMRANGEQGIPELPAAPTLFAWNGVSGDQAYNIDCTGQASSLSGLKASMKRALKGPDATTTYVSTNEIRIVTNDQFMMQPDKSPTIAALIQMQNQPPPQQMNGLGIAWALVILIATIAVTVTVSVLAILRYLEASEIQEANIAQVQAQADAFANYTAARLACFTQCTGSGKSTDDCVDYCKKLVDAPSIKLPGQLDSWGVLQWIGFTVVAGAGTFAAVKLWKRHREGKPVFELPDMHSED